MDIVVSVVVLGVLVVLVLGEGGANLDAPADPSSSDYPARPEWYFLSLFQMLKLFPGKQEMIGTIVIPTAIVVVDAAAAAARPAPAAASSPTSWPAASSSPWSAGRGYLTVEALAGRRQRPPVPGGPRARPTQARERALFLAGQPGGAASRPRARRTSCCRDPLTQGRAVLEAKCLGCHVYRRQGDAANQTASDLKDFGSRAWIRGLLEDPSRRPTSARSPSATAWSSGRRARSSTPSSSTTSPTSSPRSPDPRRHDPRGVAQQPGWPTIPGLEPFQKECGKCHVIEGSTRRRHSRRPQALRLGLAAVDRPDDPQAGRPRPLRLTSRPSDQMPAFGAEQLTDNDVEMVIRYLKDDYLRPGRRAADQPRPSSIQAVAE